MATPPKPEPKFEILKYENGEYPEAPNDDAPAAEDAAGARK